MESRGRTTVRLECDRGDRQQRQPDRAAGSAGRDAGPAAAHRRRPEDRGARHAAPAQARQSGSGVAQYFADQIQVGGDRRRIHHRPRSHRKPQDRARAAPADGRTTPHLRDVAGPDRDHGFEKLHRPGQPELRKDPRLSPRGDDRPQRHRFLPRRSSGNLSGRDARGAPRRAAKIFRYALHPQGRASGLAILARYLVRAGRALFFRRPRHDRIPQGAGNLARNIVETALDAFVQADESDAILNWNSQAEAIFGWRREEVLGKNLIELIFSEASREDVRIRRRRFLSSDQGEIRRLRTELDVRRRDGTQFKAELSVTALPTRSGIVFNAFFRDLTEKMAAEERIRHSEKMEAVGQLTGGIAHDFNNILTVITGTIEILADAVGKEPQLAAIARMIDQSATRGAELTQHLLAFARKQPLEPREIDINTLIIDTAKLLRPTLGEHIEIESMFANEV